MRRRWANLLLGAVAAVMAVVYAASEFHTAQVAVYFSPSGGCTEAIVRELTAATKSVKVQAYSFTSAAIAKALVETKRRGVAVEAVLDKANQTDKYSAATFLTNQGIPTLVDAQHAISHNKIIIIDEATVITGSFNFTKAAEERNAENLLIIKAAPGLVQQYLKNYAEHKAHSQSYQRGGRAAALPSERREDGGQADGSAAAGSFIGNRNSKVFHTATCHRLPAQKNRVTFRTREEAVRAGFRPAGDCRP